MWHMLCKQTPQKRLRMLVLGVLCNWAAIHLSATQTRPLSASTAASGGTARRCMDQQAWLLPVHAQTRYQKVCRPPQSFGTSMATAHQYPTSRPVCCLCRHRRAKKHASGRHAPAGLGGPPATSASPPGRLPAAAAGGSSAGQPAAATPWTGSAQRAAATPWGGSAHPTAAIPRAGSAKPAAATPWASSAQPAAARSWPGPAACPAGAQAAAAAPCQ